MATVEVHEWLFADGTSLGCGTPCELAYWQQEGIVDPEARLGRVIGLEPASEDDRRKALWGIGDFMAKVPA
jgi:hypothetical protein